MKENKFMKVLRIIMTLGLMALLGFAVYSSISAVIDGASMWNLVITALCCVAFFGCVKMLIGIFKNWKDYWNR